MRKSPLLRLALRNAFVAGVLIIVFMVILFYVGRHPFLITPLLDFRIFLFGVFIFFTLKEFRDYHQSGTLYFWQGLFGSFVVVLVSSWIGAGGLWLFGSFEPAFVETYIEQMIVKLREFPPEEIEEFGKEAFERNLALLPATNISQLVITHFAQGLLIGMPVSLLLSVILRRTHQT